MNFGKKCITFLGMEWRGKLKEKNELFIYANNENNFYRIRLWCNEELGNNVFVTGEIRKKVQQENFFELIATLKLVSHRERKNSYQIPESNDKWVMENLNDINIIDDKDETQKSCDFSLWTVDDVNNWVVNTLKIDEKEAQILKDELFDGPALLLLDKDILKDMKLKMGTVTKLLKGIEKLN
eukprot:gene9814-2139_t